VEGEKRPRHLPPVLEQLVANSNRELRLFSGFLLACIIFKIWKFWA